MGTSLNFRDLFLRMLVIFVTTTIILFFSQENSFDLHFKIRKTQKTSNQVFLVEIRDDEPIDQTISSLLKKQVKQIFVSHFLYDQKTKNIHPYSIGERTPLHLSLDIKADNDGLVRRIRILQDESEPPLETKKTLTLNLRGPRNTFTTHHLNELKESSIVLENKTIILKPTKAIKSYTTPLGPIDESELIATYIDNKLEHRFIPEKRFLLPTLILILLLILTTGCLIYFPSTLALISIVALTILYLSLSLWFFDSYNYWTPLLLPIIQILLTFLLISNYKHVLNEKTRWSLEKESTFLNQVEEMKTNFLSLFSHDLKTPLAKIMGIVDTLQTKISDPEVQQELEKIYQSSKELDKYIKRILKMSQVESRNMALNKESVDLNTIIEQAIEQNQYLAQRKNITLEKQLAPLFMVDLDASLIKEVIINFLENAITYSPQDSQVLVTSCEVGDFIKFSVKDNGPGIPEDIQEKVWDKSYRFDTTTTGYGLGLFLSRYVVNLHKGQVFLNSTKNTGSEFGFLIPLDEDTNETT